MALPGVLSFNGSEYESSCLVFNMFSLQTEEYRQFTRTNHFISGVFALSVFLVIYAQWTRIIAIMLVVAIIYSPLNDLHEPMLTGEYSKIYLILPPVLGMFSDSMILWIYGNYEMLLMLMGGITALVSYALIHYFNNGNPRIVIPVFTLFVFGYSSLYIFIVEQEFLMLTIHNSILFALAVMFGFRFWINKASYN